MDVLSDLLSAAAVRGVVGAQIEAGADWGWWAAQSRGAALHAVTSGTMWLRVGDEEPRELLAGDVVLLPRGTEHVLGSDLAALARTGPERFDAADLGDFDGAHGVVRIGRPPERTHVLCAHYLHDTSVATPVLPALPDVVHVRAEDESAGLEDTVRLLGRELSAPQLATSVVLDHLVDILLVQLLRAWLAGAPADALPGSLGALRDPVVGEALARLHAAPAEAWTAEELARSVAVS
ncbi:MAG TPA: cupin domain-containing protein, partial [Solirubrobacteraceae bacterium]|nr:cupin domain-containing protein [Solirubrobacteraceae bacterium]